MLLLDAARPRAVRQRRGRARSCPAPSGQPLAAARAAARRRRAGLAAGGAGAARPRAAEPPLARLPDGRAATLAWRRLDSGEARAAPAAARRRAAPQRRRRPTARRSTRPSASSGTRRSRPRCRTPTSASSTSTRPIVEFTGRSREGLIGRDPIELQPAGRPRQQPARRARPSRARLGAGRAGAAVRAPPDRRRRPRALVPRARAQRVHRRAGPRAAARGACRTRPPSTWRASAPTARRASSTTGSTSARWAWCCSTSAACWCAATRPSRRWSAACRCCCRRPAPALQQLLCWQRRRGRCRSCSPARRRWSARSGCRSPTAARCALRSIVRCYKAPGGQRRYMAVVEDRSVEEERDLAQMQIGAMMDTAGVGLATFQESSGWVRQRQARRRRPGAPLGAAGDRPRRRAARVAARVRAAAARAAPRASAPRCATRSATPSSASAGCSRASSRPRWPRASAPPRSSRSTSPSSSRRSSAARSCCAR